MEQCARGVSQPPGSSPGAALSILVLVLLAVPACVRGVAAPAGPVAHLNAADETDDWLIDENGNRYRVERLPKEELGKFERLEDGRLRTPWGMVISYEDEDEAAFYLRRYEPGDFVPEDRHAPPTPEEIEAVEASYRFEVTESDRLDFEPFDEGLPKSGQWRNGFEVADMNGDGHLDIVHGPPRKLASLPVIFLGDGTGGWRSWEEAVFPPFAYDYGDVAVADFDGDGRLDIGLATHLRGQVAMVQSEPGRFALWTEGIEFASGKDDRVFSSRTLVSGDWDGDGRPDLLALGEGPILQTGSSRGTPARGSYGIVLYRNRGDGSWERLAGEGGLDDGFGDDLVLGDFDGDGRLDALRASSMAGDPRLLYLGNGETWERRRLDGVRPNAYVRAVSSADFDGDGRLDLALAYAAYEVGRWLTGIDLFLGAGDGEWERRSVFARRGLPGLFALATGDLDGDGHVDLAALGGDGGVLLFLGTGAGDFTLEEDDLLPEAQGCRGYDVQLVDLDRDGRDEILAAFAGEPKGMIGVLQLPGCPGLGSLHVWTPRLRSDGSGRPAADAGD